MKQTTIEKVKIGKWFQFSEKGNLYVADGYNASTRKYSYSKVSDISSFGERKKGTKVFVD